MRCKTALGASVCREQLEPKLRRHHSMVGWLPLHIQSISHVAGLRAPASTPVAPRIDARSASDKRGRPSVTAQASP